METKTRVQALQRAQGDCAPSEGEAKMREICTPSEGGKRRMETKTRVQALQRVPDDYAPSEGVGRWEEADGNENAGTGATEGPR